MNACTKIVATLGPASQSPEAIRRLLEAGVEVFRLNFSHGRHDAHALGIETIRSAAHDTGITAAILQDLQGPRIRTGILEDHTGCTLAKDSEVVVRSGDFNGNAQVLAVNYERLPTDVAPGDRILISDGTIELEVLSTNGIDIQCRVIIGGLLGEHKGINLPGSNLSISAPTEKDLEDMRFGMDQGVDYVALSFVEKPQDITSLKDAMKEYKGYSLPVIPKIERPIAVDNLAAILDVSDGVMVARGDLGIEMPTETVPIVQKQIIREANRRGLPVITATQMLDSMIKAPRPTRAEAGDVANAILDGTDAVMLSGETSVGNYPAETVATMNRIALKTEEYRATATVAPPPAPEGVSNAQQAALAQAACQTALSVKARAIVAFTISGSSARYVSQRRPALPIYALTPDEQTLRRLALVWGVQAVLIDSFTTTDEMIEQGGNLLLQKNLVSPGDTVVYVAGAATDTPGGTDLLKIHRF